MPNLLVEEIVNAIRVSQASKIYICNVATQPGETDHYTLHDHVQAIEDHTELINSPGDDYAALENDRPHLSHEFRFLFDHVLVNNNLDTPIPPTMSHLSAILPTHPKSSEYTVVEADVVDETYPWRHDFRKLANQLMEWYKTTA